ncbi:MAG: hypothetical protein SFU56_08625 [Capsulimonadales bacterium]|nr:hypothetical protein [Capsulimonadales bacterium]
MGFPPALRLVLLAFAVYQSRDLALAWRDAPYERFSLIAFLLWVVPVIVARWRKERSEASDSVVDGIAVVCLVAKSVTGLNLLAYIGLALMLSRFGRPTGRGALFVWSLGAFLWMPVTGWGLSTVDPALLGWMRVTLVALISLGSCTALRSESMPLAEGRSA